MNSSAFGRLVWKESRAQISLWAALALGALLLQTLLMATSGGIRDASTAFDAVGGIAFVLTTCFVVASLGLLFAGESEEGTRDLLQQLPVRPWTLVTSKLLFAIVSGALFFATTMGTGLLVAVVSGHSIADLLRDDVSSYQKSLAGAFVWGLLFSLLFRRVMYVLLAAVIAEILTVFSIEMLFNHRMSGHGGPEAAELARMTAYLVVTGGVLILDLILARRWAGPGGQSVIAAPRQLSTFALPGAESRSRTWLRLVAWAARRGNPDAREVAVLLWREARAAVPFLGVWLVLGLFATDLGLFVHVRGQALYQSPFQVLYLIATPAICGLMACLGEQRQQMFRFLGERGVSPARVWWVKQCVWLGVAIVLCLVFLRWDSRAAQRLRSGDHFNVSTFMTLVHFIHVPTVQVEAVYDRPQDTALQVRCLWALGCALYAAGQCASFWIRRPILAFGGVLIAAPILLFWHWLLTVADIPFSIGSWPLTIALLAVGSPGTELEFAL